VRPVRRGVGAGGAERSAAHGAENAEAAVLVAGRRRHPEWLGVAGSSGLRTDRARADPSRAGAVEFLSPCWISANVLLSERLATIGRFAADSTKVVVP
jgi:hypothetical protein